MGVPLVALARPAAASEKLIYQLADFPHRLGDYRTTDSTGRFLENLRLEGYVVTYWPDNAVNE